MIILLFVFSMFAITPITPVKASGGGTVNGSGAQAICALCSSLSVTLTGITAGDLLILDLSYLAGSSSNASLPATDNMSNTWIAYRSNFESALLCYGGNDYVTSGCWTGIEYAVAQSSGIVTITADFGTIGYYWIAAIDTTGFGAPAPTDFSKVASPRNLVGSNLKCVGDQSQQVGCVWWYPTYGPNPARIWTDQELVVDSAAVVLCYDTSFAAPVGPYTLIGEGVGGAFCTAGAMTYTIGSFAQASNTGCTHIPGGTFGCIAGYNSGLTSATNGWVGLAAIFPLSNPIQPGVLYGCTSNNTGASSLYTISTVNGAATLVGAMNIFGCSGLAFNSSSTLFAVGQPNQNAQEYLFTIDLTSGVATAVGEINATSTTKISDISFQPSTNTLFGTTFSGALAQTTTPPTIVNSARNNGRGFVSLNLTVTSGDVIAVQIGQIGNGTFANLQNDFNIPFTNVGNDNSLCGVHVTQCGVWSWYSIANATGTININATYTVNDFLGLAAYDIFGASTSQIGWSSGTCNPDCSVSSFSTRNNLVIASAAAGNESGTWVAGTDFTLIAGQPQFPTTGFYSASMYGNMSGPTTAPLAAGTNNGGEEAAMSFNPLNFSQIARLYTFSTTNGTPTLKGVILDGQIAGNAMAFAPGDTLHWANSNDSAFGPAFIHLNTLNLANGAPTFNFQADGTAICGFYSIINALAFNQTALFGTLDCNPEPQNPGIAYHLVRVDIFTHIITDIGVTVDTIDGLAFSRTSSPPPNTFAASITNADCGNCVIAGNGKFYDFRASVSSDAVDSINHNYNFAVTSISFNDSIHSITIYYFYGNHTTILAGGAGATVTLGSTKATDTYDASSQTYSTVVDFYITFNSNVLDAANRGLYLQSCLNELGLFHCTSYIQTDTFNILNVGGLTETLKRGDCGKVPGGDVFSTECNYSSPPYPAWIATNSTWIDLQSYSTQFSYVVSDNGTGNAQYWQDYGKSSGGAENSANANDWATDIGFYFFDNSTWVKGPHVVVSMQRGDNGTNDEWTVLNTVFYNGNTLVSNQSISAWIEQNPLSQVRIFVDIWYNTVNASTTWGMRTNAYWLGMNQAVYLGLWGGSWSPRIQNASTSQAYGTLFDHNGDVFSSTQIQCTKVFWNMSRLGPPEVHMGQNNFRITSNQFQIQQFNLAASLSQMGGVVTPIYTAPEIPNLPQAGFFSPLYAAIQSIAGFFVNALVALGNVVWQQLSVRFPWFTTTISIFTLFIAQYYNFLTFLINTILGLLTWLYSIIGIVFIPINILISAYNYIQITYLPIFGGVPLSAMIEIMVIVFFASAFFDWMSKGDTGKFVQLARISWNIVNTIYYGLYWIAKFLVDAIEGLIP